MAMPRKPSITRMCANGKFLTEEDIPMAVLGEALDLLGLNTSTMEWIPNRNEFGSEGVKCER